MPATHAARVKITTREIGDASGRRENKNEHVSHFLPFCVDNLHTGGDFHVGSRVSLFALSMRKRSDYS